MTLRRIIASEDRAWFDRTAFRDSALILRFPPREVAALSQSSETFAVRVAEIMTDNPSSAPREGGSRGSAPDTVFVKRYRYRTFLGRLQGAFRGTFFGRSRARFEYETLAAIRERGVAAVRPIAFIESRKRGFVRACVLITEAERDAQPLDQWLRGRGLADGVDRAARRRWMEHLAAFVARMHEAGVVHGALLGRNILVAEAKSDSPRFVILDPNPRGSLSASPASPAGRGSDLSDLAATALPFTTRTERSRFLRAYLGRRKFANADRAMIAEIERRAIRQAATERHRQTIAAAILWLQERIRSRAVSRSDGSLRRYASLDEFVSAMDGARLPGTALAAGAERTVVRGMAAKTKELESSPRSIDIRLADGRAVLIRTPSENGASAVCLCSVSSGSGTAMTSHAAAGDSRAAVADLQIACDEPTFLAAINGEPEALERARKGRIDVRGDSALLDVLSSLADAPCVSVARRG